MIICDQPNDTTYSDKIKSIEYNAALSIAGDVKGTSKEKLCQQLGLESLKDKKIDKECYLYELYQLNCIIVCMR